MHVRFNSSTWRMALPALLALFLGTRGSAQGPISGFPMAKGKAAIALTYSTDNYDTYLLPDDVEEARDIETLSYSFFAEWGMSDRASLVATLPYMQTNDGDGSLQDAALWIKYMNLDRRGERFAHRFFTAVGLSTPVGDYETTTVEAIGQRATVFQGRLTYQFQHDAGWFVQAQSGIDFQFAPEASSSWPVLLRTGYGAKYFYVEGWYEFITALESGSGLQSATAGTGSSWQRVGVTGYVPITKWLGVSVGGAWVTSGNFIGKSRRVNAGVIFNLNAGKE
ncbi:hypothetical protein [Lewinella sp. 4G2]|uniref:hypothetical protein n=1 Tax=Lewinella sp. 4G2 TaxID=1803372 RepID=UPI0007B4DA70|nr:hypothetical protein [Lewinella sp. 4G2]OAV42735.1 hypothetical protein A3850_015965 [Lewinella sp. 4G2]